MSCCYTFPVIVGYIYGTCCSAQHTHTRARASFCVLNFLLAAGRPNLAQWKVERACCVASLSCLQCVSFVAVPTTADSAAAVSAIKKIPVCACRIISSFCVRCYAVVRVAVFGKWNITATGVSGCIHETWNRKQVDNWGMTDWHMSGGAACRCPNCTPECYSWCPLV
jgi:hypothetical protein